MVYYVQNWIDRVHRYYESCEIELPTVNACWIGASFSDRRHWFTLRMHGSTSQFFIRIVFFYGNWQKIEKISSIRRYFEFSHENFPLMEFRQAFKSLVVIPITGLWTAFIFTPLQKCLPFDHYSSPVPNIIHINRALSRV